MHLPTPAEAIEVLADVHDFVVLVWKAGDVKAEQEARGKAGKHQSDAEGVGEAECRRHTGAPDFNGVPLTIELLLTGTGSATVIAAVVYLFKNPDKIGEWWPKVQTSWYDGRAEMERAKKRYKKLCDTGTRTRELK